MHWAISSVKLGLTVGEKKRRKSAPWWALTESAEALGWVCLVWGAPRASWPGGQRGEPWLLQAPAAGLWGPVTMAIGPWTPTPVQSASKKAHPLFQPELSVVAGLQEQHQRLGSVLSLRYHPQPQCYDRPSTLGWEINVLFFIFSGEMRTVLPTAHTYLVLRSHITFMVSCVLLLPASRKRIWTAARKEICCVRSHLTCTSLTGKSIGGHFITDTF